MLKNGSVFYCLLLLINKLETFKTMNSNINAGMKKQLRSHPRKYGKDSRGCRVTGGLQGLVRKYGINMSRRTFREQAEIIGFKKYR